MTDEKDKKPDGRGKSADSRAHYFQKGVSGNPSGKPKNARNRLQVGFLNALADDFEAHGVQAIKDAREQDPMKYVSCIAALMPKQVEETKPLDDLSDAELVAALAFIRSRITGGSGEGAGEAPGSASVN